MPNRYWISCAAGILAMSMAFTADGQAADEASAKRPAQSVYEMYSEEIRSDGLRIRYLSAFEVYHDAGGIDDVKLVWQREFGEDQTLLVKTRPSLRFRFTPQHIMPDPDVIRRAADGPAGQGALNALIDFAMLYGAKPVYGEPVPEDGAEDEGPQLFSKLWSAISGGGEEVKQAFAQEPVRVVLSWPSSGAPVVRHQCHQRIGSIADDVLITIPDKDAEEPGRLDPITYAVRWDLPEQPCASLAGQADRSTNLFGAVRSGADWTHVTGSERAEIEARIDPLTGRTLHAALQAHRQIVERQGCTQHGALCDAGRRLRVERHVELSRVADARRM